MGCWNEAEAKRRFEESVRRRKEVTEKAKAAQVAAKGKPKNTTLFDAVAEGEKMAAAPADSGVVAAAASAAAVSAAAGADLAPVGAAP